MRRAYINLGANLGDRRATILEAVREIEHRLGSEARLSSFYRSEPWGYTSSNEFLNLGLLIDTELGPRELMEVLLEIQGRYCTDSHRDSRGNYCDRTLDIDLILLGDMHYTDEVVTVPHPRMQERDFVMQPLRELLEGEKLKN